jgi:hypothetical protein
LNVQHSTLITHPSNGNVTLPTPSKHLAHKVPVFKRKCKPIIFFHPFSM